jgi:hypothetical protein
MPKKLILRIACIVEIAAGIAWLIAPSIIIPQVVGGELSSAGIGLGRIAGFGLISLGIACWPMPEVTPAATLGMLVYNVLTTAYLAYIVVRWGHVGKLLAPSLVLHGVLTLVLVFVWLRQQNEVQATPPAPPEEVRESV